MPGLQPVLKMKVDELFFKWLSDPATRTQLKQYLELIKSGQPVDLANGTAEDKNSPFGENNNVTSHRSLAGKKPAPISTPCSHPSTGALPSGSSSNPRVSGPSARTLRKSLSTKKVKSLFSVSCNCTKLALIPFPFTILSRERGLSEDWDALIIKFCPRGLHFTVKHWNKVCPSFQPHTFKASHPKLLWNEAMLHNMYRRGHLLLFCNSRLQNSSHGLGGYATSKQQVLIN